MHRNNKLKLKYKLYRYIFKTNTIVVEMMKNILTTKIKKENTKMARSVFVTRSVSEWNLPSCSVTACLFLWTTRTFWARGFPSSRVPPSADRIPSSALSPRNAFYLLRIAHNNNSGRHEPRGTGSWWAFPWADRPAEECDRRDCEGHFYRHNGVLSEEQRRPTGEQCQQEVLRMCVDRGKVRVNMPLKTHCFHNQGFCRFYEGHCKTLRAFGGRRYVVWNTSVSFSLTL